MVSSTSPSIVSHCETKKKRTTANHTSPGRPLHDRRKHVQDYLLCSYRMKKRWIGPLQTADQQRDMYLQWQLPVVAIFQNGPTSDIKWHRSNPASDSRKIFLKTKPWKLRARYVPRFRAEELVVILFIVLDEIRKNDENSNDHWQQADRDIFRKRSSLTHVSRSVQ
jgi:hypothetical protein